MGPSSRTSPEAVDGLCRAIRATTAGVRKAAEPHDYGVKPGHQAWLDGRTPLPDGVESDPLGHGHISAVTRLSSAVAHAEMLATAIADGVPWVTGTLTRGTLEAALRCHWLLEPDTTEERRRRALADRLHGLVEDRKLRNTGRLKPEALAHVDDEIVKTLDVGRRFGMTPHDQDRQFEECPWPALTSTLAARMDAWGLPGEPIMRLWSGMTHGTSGAMTRGILQATGDDPRQYRVKVDDRQVIVEAYAAVQGLRSASAVAIVYYGWSAALWESARLKAGQLLEPYAERFNTSAGGFDAG